ncbi:MAG: TadE family protein [Pseudomonadota bacterium]
MEFVVVFPVFIASFFWVMEIGYVFFQTVQLDRGVDLMVRELMINDVVRPSMSHQEAHDTVKDILCGYTSFIKDCDEKVTISLDPVTNFSVASSSIPECINGVDSKLNNIQSASNPTSAVQYTVNEGTCNNQIVRVEACLLFDTFFPPIVGNIRYSESEDATYEIRSTAAYLNEC